MSVCSTRPVLHCYIIVRELRHAEKNGSKFLASVADTGMKQFGMRLFMLVSHYNMKGELMVSS
jgi:hypothetical protein